MHRRTNDQPVHIGQVESPKPRLGSQEDQVWSSVPERIRRLADPRFRRWSLGRQRLQQFAILSHGTNQSCFQSKMYRPIPQPNGEWHKRKPVQLRRRGPAQSRVGLSLLSESYERNLIDLIGVT